MAEMQFDQIVAEHYATLYRFALSLTRDEAESLDLTQQTFYLWATKGGQLRDAAKLKAAPLPEDLLEQIRAGTQARLTLWRQASLPDVEGGILPPGPASAHRDGLDFTDALTVTECFPPGWKPGSTAAKDGRRHRSSL